MTAQVSETLIYEGEEVQLHSEPNFPHDHPEIVKSESNEGIYNSTACWRGYVGTWELKNRKFFLNSLQGKYQLKTTPIEANWFTGQLVIPESGQGEYFHGGWGHDYAQNKIITVVNGVVTNIEYQDKTTPGFIEGWAKTRLNRTFGAIAEASDNCYIQLDENVEGNKLIIFTFKQKNVLESMVGKLLVAAQESNVALPIATCLAQPNLVKGNTDHMMTVSVSLNWAVELEKTFVSSNWAGTENSVDNINGFWHFSEKEKQNTQNSDDNIWDNDIPF